MSHKALTHRAERALTPLIASRGFTLLELMIAMAILALSLVALLGHQSVAIQGGDFSNRVSQAAFLLEGKLLDVKHKILSESVDIYDNCEEGDFKDEGFRRRSEMYRWKVCTFKLEIQEGASEQLTEQIGAALMGVGGEGAMGGGGLGALAAQQGMDPMDPNGQLGKMMGQIQMATGAIPMLLQQLEDKVRKVRIEVSWKDKTRDRRVLVERFVTSLGSDSAAGMPPPEDSIAQENQKSLERDIIDSGGQVPPGGK
jgi:prepilin-type N-terminal cleavage/methylation domain-containing protein